MYRVVHFVIRRLGKLRKRLARQAPLSLNERALLS